MASFLKKLDYFSPALCRLLAVRYPAGRRGWPIALTDEEIAQRSTLTLREVRRISSMMAWTDVRHGQMVRYLNGCRLNLVNWNACKRIKRLADRGKFNYLRRSHLWKRRFVPLLTKVQHARAGNTAPTV